MPVFLAGKTAAITLANALDVRLIELSHQQGHVRAALYGNEQLMGRRFLGMHISGGTTEIFTVGSNLEIGLVGGCADLHAGQLVDRVGVSLAWLSRAESIWRFLLQKGAESLPCGCPYGFAARNAHFRAPKARRKD